MAESSSHHPVPHSAKSLHRHFWDLQRQYQLWRTRGVSSWCSNTSEPYYEWPSSQHWVGGNQPFSNFVQDALLKLQKLPNPFKPTPTNLPSDKLRKSRHPMPPLSSNVVSSPGHTLTSIPAPNSLKIMDPPHSPLSKISDHPGHNLDTKTVECLADVKKSQTSHQDQSVPPLKAPESSAGCT